MLICSIRKVLHELIETFKTTPTRAEVVQRG